MTDPRAKLRIAAGIAVIAILLGWSVMRMTADPSSLPVRDFVEYYSAGSVYLAGGNPYSGPELVEVQRRVLNNPDLDDATMMWNPPWVFAVVAPFAVLPVGVAHKLWLLVQILCVFGSVWMIWKTYGGPRGKEWIGWVTAATFPPVLFVVWWGQIGGIVLLGLAGLLYFRTRDRPWIAGLFAALTAIKPHLLFAVGLVLVLEAFVSKAGRKVVLAGAAAVIVAALAAWVTHPGIYDLYRSAGWESSSTVNVSPKDWVQPLASYWLRVAIDPNRFGIQFVPTAIVAVGVVGYWWVRRKNWDWKVEMPRLIFASVIAAAYGAWLFDLVVLLVPVVHAVTAMTNRPTRNKSLIIAYALVMGLAVFVPTLALTPLTGLKVGLQYYVWFAPAVLLFYLAALRVGRPYNAPRDTTGEGFDMADAGSGKHRVVIVGGGFGGLLCAQHLKTVPVDVTLIDRRNFHLFQPLLYQVATGGLSPANIAAPLRSILKFHANARVLLGEVSDFDVVEKNVIFADGAKVPFDTLVLATGSTHHYFGKDAAWGPIAPGLKTLEDATEIRRKVLSAFEKAERESDPAERARLLTFVVVGGGPTGVEMAGSVSDLARQTLVRDFRSIHPGSARIVLVEGQPRMLPTFHEKLSAKAADALKKMGVELWFDCHVTEVAADHVLICPDKGAEPKRIETETVIWAAGVKASPLGKKLAERLGAGVVTDKGGRIATGPDCTVPGHPEVFVVGDLATHNGADGKPLPGVAPVAMQQGKYVAEVIRRRVKGESPPAGFKYLDKGSMATIGRSRAVLESGPIRLWGYPAWLGWLFIHIMYLARFENRVLVLFQWFWNYVTRNRTARLITGEKASR